MVSRWNILLIILLLSWNGAAYTAGGRVEFKNNRLKVDGKPFFFYGCWSTPNGDYAEFKRRHFNTAFMNWRSAVKEGTKAASAGLMVIPYPYAPGWNNKVKTAMQSIAKEDWILAWNIGDDLNKKEHINAALRVRDEIHALDPQHRPIMFDAIGLYEQFAKIPDMWCAYAYPLVKSVTVSPPAYKPAGLREYGSWLNRMRMLGRPDGFFWTWAQCHVQIWYTTRYLGATDHDHWRPSRFPDGDHLRLIAAHAISAGCRGLMWFVCYYFQDDHLGRDRYARAAIIGCELDIVGPLIAQGRTGERLKTSDPTVWATPIDFPGGRLICLLKTGDFYNYQPDVAEAKDVRVEVGMPGNVYQIGYDFTKLAAPRCSFKLTSWLLVTDDHSLVEELKQTHRIVLPDMARFAVEELEARIAKVKPIFKQLGREADAVSDARAKLSEAHENLAQKKWSAASKIAEEGLCILRIAQHRVWREMWTPDVRQSGLNVTDFYLLPKVAQQIELLKANAWGANQLRNGSFESDEGWHGAKLVHNTNGKAAFLSNVGRNGSHALRLWSDSPTIYQGQPHDWVTVNVVSDKISAKPNELWEIAAWMRVPKRIEQTQRGVTIALFAYNKDGKQIPGYAPELEARQIDATTDWKRIRLIVPLHSPDVTSIAARLSLCGIGEVYLDDVTVRRLEMK